MTNLPAVIPASRPTKRDLAALLAALTDEQITFLSYEACDLPEYDHVPCWFFDACYDEGDRRMMVKLAAGTHPAFPGRKMVA